MKTVSGNYRVNMVTQLVSAIFKIKNETAEIKK